MTSTIEIPQVRVFMSYSWTSKEHEDWVLELATRLTENGIDLKLDKWDLKEGQDIYSFMENMVSSKDIDKVLVVCDKGYAEKAEKRAGGVGTETQIITPEVYKDIEQEKFIPILAERGSNNEEYIPTYMKTRKYIDMSSEEVYEQGFEKLLRNLYQRPEHFRPERGKPPGWLFEDGVQHFKTTNTNKQLQNAFKRNPSMVKGLSKRFVDEFLEILEQFQEEPKGEEPVDELIVNSINKLLPLRDDFINFLEFQCQSYEEIDIDILIDFFERIYRFTCERITEHYKFLIQELFLYTVMVLLDNSQHNKLGELLNSEFFILKNVSGDLRNGGFDIFQFYLPIIEEQRKKRLNSKRLSLTAELLVHRTTLRKYTKQKLVEADLLLYYLSSIYDRVFNRLWFPRTYVYGEDVKVQLLQRLVSKRFFEKVKILLGVENPQELKNKIISFKNEYRSGFSGSFEGIEDIQYHIDPEKICTLP